MAALFKFPDFRPLRIVIKAGSVTNAIRRCQ